MSEAPSNSIASLTRDHYPSFLTLTEIPDNCKVYLSITKNSNLTLFFRFRHFAPPKL